MTDDPHPDLAGLAPAPLTEPERMDAAAARLERMVSLRLLPAPMHMAFSRFAAVLRSFARNHREIGCRSGEPCDMAAIADALLGNEAAT